MLATLFLPTFPFPSLAPNFFFMLYYSAETLSRMFSEFDITHCIDWLPQFFFWSAISLLLLLNVCLLIRVLRGLRVLYRMSVLILLPLTWYATLQADPQWWGVGLYAIPAVVTVAALMEVAFLINELRRK